MIKRLKILKSLKILWLVLLIFYLISFFSNNINAQEGIVTYSVSNNLEKVNSYFNEGRDTLKNNYLKSTLDDIYGPSLSIKSILKFTKSESVYKIEQKLQNEKENILAYKLLHSIAGGSNLYFSNLQLEKNIIQECELLGECFLIDMPKTEWILTQKQKKIGNYVCYLATAVYKTYLSTTKVEAWFTPDISVSTGPMSFIGLPGLVLELKTNKLQFVATNIVLSPKEKIQIKRPAKGIKVTSDKFEEILKEAFPDFYKRLEFKRKNN
jgi:GLPGLI family protein